MFGEEGVLAGVFNSAVSHAVIAVAAVALVPGLYEVFHGFATTTGGAIGGAVKGALGVGGFSPPMV